MFVDALYARQADQNLVVHMTLAARGLSGVSKGLIFKSRSGNPFLRISRIGEGNVAVPCFRTEVKMDNLK
jgi:hypothetical protein